MSDGTTIVLPKKKKRQKKKETLFTEVGLRTFITDKALQKDFEQRTLEALKDRVLSTFYRHCIVRGEKPVAIGNRIEKDAARRGIEAVFVIGVEENKAAIATFLKVNEENDRLTDALLNVNNSSLFSLIKSKLLRKKLIEMDYKE